MSGRALGVHGMLRLHLIYGELPAFGRRARQRGIPSDVEPCQSPAFLTVLPDQAHMMRMGDKGLTRP